MSDNQDALRLADALDSAPYSSPTTNDAAEELRRLHEAHEWQYKMAGERLRRIEKLEALNAELVEALCCCRDMVAHPDNLAFIDAALAKAGASNGS